jgi:hypothetical protein
MKHKSPYGIRDNKVIEIHEVESGLKCNCTCSVCGHRLVARKGNIRAGHFAHHKGSECEYSIETSLHLAAKDFLESSKKIVIPAVTAKVGEGYGQELILSSEKEITFDKVFLEKRTDDIVPDIIVEKNGVQLFIEIAVTHFIDEEKSEKIQRIGISTLEIDLSDWKYDFRLDDLQTVLFSDTKRKKWIFNRKAEIFRIKVNEGKEKKMVISNGYATHVYNCPIHKRVYKGKPFANLIDDCWYCDFYFGGEENEHGGLDFIWCNGHQKKRIDELIRLHKEKAFIK